MSVADILKTQISFIQIYILLSFFWFLYHFVNDKIFYFLLVLYLVCITNEIFLCYFSLHKMDVGFNTSAYVIIHNVLWLIILSEFFSNKKIVYFTIIIYISFSIVNLLFFEGLIYFNYNTFILGSLIYLILFLIECFIRLEAEDINFFKINKFILIVSPVLFFLGLSMIFGFHSKRLSYYKIFDIVPLYTIITYFVNFIYYSLLNIYIFKERKLKNAT